MRAALFLAAEAFAFVAFTAAICGAVLILGVML
jgi:hypothetical protein